MNRDLSYAAPASYRRIQEPPPMASDWVKWGIGLGTAAVVAYYTTTNAISVEMREVKTTEKLHYEATTAAFSSLHDDVKEIRAAMVNVARNTRKIAEDADDDRRTR